MKKRIFILVLMIFVYLFSYHYFINQSKQVYVAEKEIVITNEIDNNDIAVFSNAEEIETITIHNNIRDDVAIVFAAMRPFEIYINNNCVYSYQNNDTYKRIHIIPIPKGDNDVKLVSNTQQYSIKAHMTTMSNANRMCNNALAINSISIGLNFMIFFLSIVLYREKKTEKYLLLLLMTSFMTLIASFLTSSLPLLLTDQQYVSIQFIVNIIMELLCFLVIAFLLLDLKNKRNQIIIKTISCTSLLLMFMKFGWNIPFTGSIEHLILFLCVAWILSNHDFSLGLLNMACAISLMYSISEYTSLVNNGILPNTRILLYLYTPQIGWTIFVIIVTGIVAKRFAKKFSEADSLNAKLEQMNKTLDIKVEERTKQLILQQEQKSNLMINIFHDLKSPIFGALGCADMIQVHDKENKELLDILKERLNFVSRLTEQLFMLAKLENQSIKYHDSYVEMKSYLNNILNAFEIECKDKNVIVRRKLEENIYFYIDSFHFAQVIQNLLQNALNYTNDNSTIFINLKKINSQGIIEVIDQGPGIKEEDLPHIFERYYQGQYATKSRSQGLGLSIASQIIKQEKGQIKAENLPEGGAKFTIIMTIDKR